jgi:RNA polymerase sigma-70 factor (ECF subfamily)
VPAASIRTLYEKSGASAWDVSLEAFSARVRAAVDRRFRDEVPAPRAVEAFVESLHVQDLALACACAAGHERAWEHFIRELRPGLYAAARQLPGGSQELADSLYAELFGVDARGAAKRSVLEYYHGRASLATWLRTVLAQRNVDALRAQSRLVPLEDAGAGAERVAPAAPEPHRAEHVAAVQRALDAALAALDPRDRLRLRLYYGEGVKLAAIGKLLGEHEATSSRKLERVRRAIRERVERELGGQLEGMGEVLGEVEIELAGQRSKGKGQR